jgi:iron complex transport system substrate-binding protein
MSRLLGARGMRLLAIALAAAAMTTACATGGDAPTGAQTGRTTATLERPDPEPIAERPVSNLPVTVRSADGVDVTITDTSRVVAADQYGTLTETVYALGFGDRLVGRDIAAKFPAVESVPNVTPSGRQLSAEAILNLHPTVVLTDSSIGPRAVQDQLRAAGIPVVYFDPSRSLASVPDQIQAVADALGVPAEGTALRERTAAEIAEASALVPSNADPLTIAFLYMRGPAITMLAGPGSGADSLIEGLGATDAGTAAGLTKDFTPITSEAMIAAAPDVFLMMTGGLESIGGVEGLTAIPGIAQTPAGSNQRIVDMQDGALLSFGPRTGAVLKALATAVYGPPAQ